MNETIKQNEFLELFEPVRTQLSGFCRALSKTREDAKDLMSDTILKTYESFDKLKNRDAFKSYMFTIASRLNKRKYWRSKVVALFDKDEVFDIADSSSLQDILPDVEYLYKAMKKLNLAEQEAIALYEISGFHIKEVAELQECSESTVKSRLKRGRYKLMKLMSDKYNPLRILDSSDNIVRMNQELDNDLTSKILKVNHE